MTALRPSAVPLPRLRERVRLAKLRPGLPGIMSVVLGLLLVVPIGAFLLVAITPRLFDQGTAAFTLHPFAVALSGPSLQALGNTALVGVGAAAVAVACGLPLALLVHRTNVIGRRAYTFGVWALLLAPSYLVALGWERLFEPAGVLALAGINAGVLRTLLYGPVGVIGVDGIKGVPFAYLAISAALPGMGSSFEHAARTLGASRLRALRTVMPIIAPAIWSSFAIVFAESISDFGVASTLAFDAHFPVATFALYNAVDNEPISFPLAAAIGCTLVALSLVALLTQRRALRGRSYQVLSGRTRPYVRHRLSRRSQLLAGGTAGLFFLIALGVPVFGAISASLVQNLGDQFAGFHLTFSNYTRVLSSGDMTSPMLYSLRLAVIVATIVMLLSVPVARLLTRRAAGPVAATLDFLLLGAVALPSIVMAAGYILIYNLPVMHSLGIALYGTTALLSVAYVAGALPNNSRILIGPLAQLHETLLTSGRTHGASGPQAWRRIGLPVLSRFIVWVWLYCFAGTLLELPISELLYPPGQFPLSVAIERRLSTYDFAGGTAMEVISVTGALVITGAVLLLYRTLTPRGWRNVGAST
ncbi:MAG TPA: ABC transporter permease subunit [Solirubrobacteraceae bacterium]|nr:ABC transporter permease subunit [Solirubrobacteraceae bacterium]